VKWGALPTNLVGVDLLPERVAEARALCPSGVRIEVGSAAKLDFPDGSFDLVLQSTVCTSVVDTQLKRQVAAEMQRVVKDDGLVLWYDYSVNNPWNPDVQGIRKKRRNRSTFSWLSDRAEADHPCSSSLSLDCPIFLAGLLHA
jgi:ubiquinone/menaquinone biosynthesis C-methylase UbiE